LRHTFGHKKAHLSAPQCYRRPRAQPATKVSTQLSCRSQRRGSPTAVVELGRPLEHQRFDSEREVTPDVARLVAVTSDSATRAAAFGGAHTPTAIRRCVWTTGLVLTPARGGGRFAGRRFLGAWGPALENSLFSQTHCSIMKAARPSDTQTRFQRNMRLGQSSVSSREAKPRPSRDSAQDRHFGASISSRIAKPLCRRMHNSPGHGEARAAVTRLRSHIPMAFSFHRLQPPTIPTVFRMKTFVRGLYLITE
jgi:hypothetical protein